MSETPDRPASVAESASLESATKLRLDDDPDMSIKITCKPCGAVFAMTDRGSRVLNAMREWDKEHKHAGGVRA